MRLRAARQRDRIREGHDSQRIVLSARHCLRSFPGAARLLWTQKQDIGVILAVEFRARLRLGSKADLPVRGERGLHGHVVVGRQVLEAGLVIRPDEANWTLDDFRHGPQLHRAVRWRTRCGTGASRHLGVRRHVVDAGRRHRSVTANRTRHRVRPEPWTAGAVRRSASWRRYRRSMGPRHLGVGRATWTQVEDAGGAKRRSHCWAYDRDRKRMSWWGHNKCVTAADGKGIRKFDHDGLRK